MISDQSGKKFKETRGERIETPVEFDQNIANLMTRIEQKRKEKIMKQEAKLRKAMEEDNNKVLEEAQNNILSRQKRLSISDKDIETKNNDALALNKVDNENVVNLKSKDTSIVNNIVNENPNAKNTNIFNQTVNENSKFNDVLTQKE